MRAALIAIATMTIATTAFASPPYANELMLPTGGTAVRAAAVPKVARGQFLGLACSSILRASGDAVRVVIQLGADAQSTGYSGVLATDQEISGDTVHVRVPDLPDLAEHVVRVVVYVTDSSGLHSCDAGKVRIV